MKTFLKRAGLDDMLQKTSISHITLIFDSLLPTASSEIIGMEDDDLGKTSDRNEENFSKTRNWDPSVR